MRFLGYPILLTLVGLLAAGVLGIIGLLGGASATPNAPGEVATAFNFGGERTMLVCWSQPDAAEVTSYDMRVTRWNFGRTRTEIVHRVATSDCGGSVGAAHVFAEDNLYHLALRACRNGRCSEWSDTSAEEAYWFQIPCRDATGAGCIFPAGGTETSGSARP